MPPSTWAHETKAVQRAGPPERTQPGHPTQTRSSGVVEDALAILRNVPSFEPRLACAAHVLDVDGNKLPEP